MTVAVTFTAPQLAGSKLAAPKRTLLAVSTLALIALSHPATAAPSLNCERPSGRVERKICGDARLMQLHRDMRRAYMTTEPRIEPRSDVAGLVTDQARWVARRNACWTKRCIAKSTIDRTETLRSWAVKRDD
jgi:uncharacterized protein